MKTSRRLSVLVCLLTCTAVGGCGERERTGADVELDAPGGAADSRIIGGSGFSGLPAVGALTYNGSQHCTATLVESRKIVTAAHCLFGVNKTKLRFVIGEDAYYPEASLKISSVAIHPYYSADQLDYDIGYAVLSEEAPVEPMGIVSQMDSSWRGEDLFFVGYGVNDGYGQTGAGKKRAVWMQISQVYSASFRYDDPNKNTCNGDSGGPAFAYTADGQYLVAGVTSYGDWYCTEYGVDTRVDVYADFLGIEPTELLPVEPPAESPPTDGCHGETFEGRCDADFVIWCENNTVYQGDCASDGKSCGWSEANSYYGCIEPPDPCNGETWEGRCDGKTVIWCEDEEVKSIDCRRQCGWDNAVGYYNCR